jgi:hypothetical protein
LVNNTDPQHPLGVRNYVLERIDAGTGDTAGRWPWPSERKRQTLSHLFRNFILGGHVRGEPVLVTAQGTYGDMYLQAWRPGMVERWTVSIAAGAPGARGSHMCPVVDLNGDGVEELLWGERCIELDTGRELFCADVDLYRGHSDIIQPVWDHRKERWFLYTTRESDPDVAPRVVLYDERGQRVWGDVDGGHMDMGWVARLGEGRESLAMAIRVGHKTSGPDGRFHQDRDEFVYEALTGRPVSLPFSVYQTLPVDINGDGYHELVRGIPGANGDVLDRHGALLGNVGGAVALASKFCDQPGEQLLTYNPDGTLQVWADRNAHDTPYALARYNHPFYTANQRLAACGYNWINLGGL